jgi:hypothetical protein
MPRLGSSGCTCNVAAGGVLPSAGVIGMRAAAVLARAHLAPGEILVGLVLLSRLAPGEIFSA